MVAPSSQHSTAPPDAATIHVTFFPNNTDTTPSSRKDMPPEDLALLLSQHAVRPDKDGMMFSLVRYAEGATRSNTGVIEVTGFVMDVDALPDWSLLEPYQYFAFTTHNHGTAAKPQAWRIVLPSARPFAFEDHTEAWLRVNVRLVPNADPGAKALSQPHYLPSCPEGATPEVRQQAGAWLDWTTLESLPPSPPRQRRAPGARQDRPGDDYNARADWADVLPDWTHVYTRRDGVELWRRPSKDRGWSATIGYGGSDVLYVFTSNAPPFEPRRSYDKFGAFAALHYGGDHAAAAQALADKGYGKPPQRWEIPDSESEHVADEPPSPNGHGSPTTEAHERPHLTDLGNAQVFIREHGAALRYCYPWSCWYAWTGRRWEEDERGRVERLAKRTVLGFYRMAADIENDAKRQALIAHARRSEAAGRLEAMVRLARSEPDIPILPDDLDHDHWLLNCLNGTIDLRTGELHAHAPADLITKLVPITYDPAAPCPQWEAFLAQILPDAAVRGFLQRAVGYAATGDTREQALFFPYGSGANGKSTLLNLVMAALGDYAKQAAPELLTYSKNDRHPTELADLVGVRFVASIEVDEGKRLAEALVKQMTGGDRMKARRMREDFFDFTPTHKVFLAANHRPVIRGTDHAIWRRIHLIPFEVTIPPDQQDKQLPTKLYAELPGILRWIVDGCLAWQRDGLGVPEAVRQATNEYRAEQDVLAGFIAEKCIEHPTVEVTSHALYTAYAEWCKASGEQPLSKKALAPRLRERGYEDRRSKTARSWVGLRLLAAEGDASRDGDAW